MVNEFVRMWNSVCKCILSWDPSFLLGLYWRYQVTQWVIENCAQWYIVVNVRHCTVEWKMCFTSPSVLQYSFFVLGLSSLAEERLNTWFICFGSHSSCPVIAFRWWWRGSISKMGRDYTATSLSSSGFSVLWEPQLIPNTGMRALLQNEPENIKEPHSAFISI